MSGPSFFAATPCPCGSGDRFERCCKRLHGGADASTAESVMRARYTAFAVHDADYLLRSWLPRTREFEGNFGAEEWTGLRILETEGGGPGDDRGIVEFEAAYVDATGPGSVRERSRFVRHNGRWVYEGAV